MSIRNRKFFQFWACGTLAQGLRGRSWWFFLRAAVDIGMSSDYLELFWTLLEDRNLEQLRSTVPRHFDWSALHPKRNTTILVEALIGFPEAEEESRCLGLIEWLVGSGASFSQKSGASTLTYTVRKCTDPSTKIAVPYKGHSALSFIAAWRQEMTPASKHQVILFF